MDLEKYDVVIVGAGSGGLKCAEELSKSDKSVLVLEKNAVIGPKVCAGGLTSSDLAYLDLPKKLIDHQFKTINVYTPHQKRKITQDVPIISTIDRTKFAQYQIKRIISNKVEIRTNSCVSRIGKSYLFTNNEDKIKFEYLVGADGSNSVVRNYLSLHNEFILAMQYIIPTRKFKHLELFFDSKLFHSWYAWIFPHKNFVSIGTGADPRYLTMGKLKTNFLKFIQLKKIDISNSRFEAFPINYNYQGHIFRKIFLVGDAAGLASGLTGEGIFQAIVSGSEVAKKILNNKYQSEKMNEIIKYLHFHKQIVKLLIKSGNFRSFEYELIMHMLESKYLDNLVLRTLLL